MMPANDAVDADFMQLGLEPLEATRHRPSDAEVIALQFASPSSGLSPALPPVLPPAPYDSSHSLALMTRLPQRLSFSPLTLPMPPCTASSSPHTAPSPPTAPSPAPVARPVAWAMPCAMAWPVTCAVACAVACPMPKTKRVRGGRVAKVETVARSPLSESTVSRS